MRRSAKRQHRAPPRAKRRIACSSRYAAMQLRTRLLSQPLDVNDQHARDDRRDDTNSSGCNASASRCNAVSERVATATQAEMQLYRRLGTMRSAFRRFRRSHRGSPGGSRGRPRAHFFPRARKFAKNRQNPGGPPVSPKVKTDTRDLSRLGELLNTLENVHFFAPPGDTGSGGVRGGPSGTPSGPPGSGPTRGRKACTPHRSAGRRVVWHRWCPTHASLRSDDDRIAFDDDRRWHTDMRRYTA